MNTSGRNEEAGSSPVKNMTKIATASPTTVTAAPPQKVEPISLSSGEWTILPASAKSVRTTNPIRAIVDPIVANIQTGQARGDGKDLISLALGDPTATGNLPPCPAAVRAIVEAVQATGHAAGYVPATGTAAARQAIARYHSNSYHTVQPDQVIVASGCSGALELALTALLDENSILLVPQVSFPLYQVIAKSHGAVVQHYKVRPENKWECDLDHLEELMEQYAGRVRGVVITNPSNPTGAVYSKRHLQDFLAVCQRHCVAVVADEIYGNLTFAQNKSHPLADLAAASGRQVPVITASGIGKQYLLPGWRVGWIVFQDNVYGSLQEVEAGAKRLAQVILGASHLAQTVVPVLLEPTKEICQWKDQLRQTLERQAKFLCRELAAAQGLSVLQPGGAMYAIIRFDPSQFDASIENEIDFSKLLLKEENVFVLPGSCFGVNNAFRVVFCAPVGILKEAADRIHNFCARHSKK